MKQMSIRIIQLTAVICALGICLGAQCKSALDNSGGNKVFSVPVSQNTIVFQVTMPTGVETKMRLFEGAMARIDDSKNAYGLAPIIHPEGVDFAVFAIRADNQGNEKAEEIEHVNTTANNNVQMQKQPKFIIKVLEIDDVNGAAIASRGSHENGTPQLKVITGDGGDCCVTCNAGVLTITTCASAVCADCGQCHDKGVQPIPNCTGGNAASQLSKFHPLDLEPLKLSQLQSSNQRTPAK